MFAIGTQVGNLIKVNYKNLFCMIVFSTNLAWLHTYTHIIILSFCLHFTQIVLFYFFTFAYNILGDQLMVVLKYMYITKKIKYLLKRKYPFLKILTGFNPLSPKRKWIVDCGFDDFEDILVFFLSYIIIWS